MKKIKLELIIERDGKCLSGRILYKENLIVDFADTVDRLETQLKIQLKNFENIDPVTVEFEHTYDVSSLFQDFDFLNISKLAFRAGINAGLLRQYASQVKHPSEMQARKIEMAFHNLGKMMQNIRVLHA